MGQCMSLSDSGRGGRSPGSGNEPNRRPSSSSRGNRRASSSRRHSERRASRRSRAESPQHNDAQISIPTGGNKPLVPRSALAWKSPVPMTRGQLTSQRDTFWDTQPLYSGRPEVWQALKACCEAQTQEMAQAIITSMNLTVPTGKLTDGCYDELGNHYVIPDYCLVEPSNLLEDSLKPNNTSDPQLIKSRDNSAQELGHTILSSEAVPAGSLLDPSIMSATRRNSVQPSIQSEKPSTASPNIASSPSGMPTSSSAMANPDNKITLVCRLSTAKDIKINVTLEDTFAIVRQLVMDAEGLNSKTTKLRIIHFGRLLEEKMKIKDDAKITTGSVIQIMIQTKPK